MYPLLRFAGEVLKYRNKPMAFDDTHVSTHRCWPWDLDPWMELNNGRTLTLYDLGRVPMFIRSGATDTLKKNGWGVTVAGVSVRYRRRITAFEKVTITSKLVGWDKRFHYTVQSIWKKDGDCANQVLLRSALVGSNGIVDPADLTEAMGLDRQSPEMPAWIHNWIEAENTRPWPPEDSPLA